MAKLATSSIRVKGWGFCYNETKVLMMVHLFVINYLFFVCRDLKLYSMEGNILHFQNISKMARLPPAIVTGQCLAGHMTSTGETGPVIKDRRSNLNHGERSRYSIKTGKYGFLC